MFDVIKTWVVDASTQVFSVKFLDDAGYVMDVLKVFRIADGPRFVESRTHFSVQVLCNCFALKINFDPLDYFWETCYSHELH